MNKWARFICLLLLAAPVGCVWERDDDDDEVKIDVAAYADFRGQWVYDNDFNSNTLTITYQGVQTVGGRSVHVLEDDGGEAYYYREDLSDKLYLEGTQSADFYEDALPLLRDRFDPGEVYGPYQTDDNDCRVFLTYRREDVSVPYDDFNRTVLTTATTECVGRLPRVEKYWFARDVGLVKWVDSDGEVWLLDDRN